jgi:hypothetical protein
MKHQNLFIIATLFIAGFFFSCKESTQEEELTLSAKDSIDTTLEGPEFLVNDDDTPATEKIDIPDEKFSSLSQVSRRLNKRSSYFVIKNARDTVIQCKEGTLLAIPANAFVNGSDRTSTVNEVKISVKEFYKMSDMLTQGLTTTSNNQLLESGGMINIQVINKKTKDTCMLKPGKTITIAMPSADLNNADGMQLFNGMHDSTGLNWLPRPGIAGYAQGWRFTGNNFSQNLENNFSQKIFELSAGFVFPDEVPKVKPQFINSSPEDLKAEVKIPLRDLMQTVGVATKKANAYIDTSGNLHCYKIGYTQQKISFARIYSPTTIEDTKVNLAVDVFLKYKSHLNHDYYQKLFKMGKGNPDSLVTIQVTLMPALKLTNTDRMKGFYNNVWTVKEFKKRQRKRDLLVKEYERRVKELRLEDENRLAKLEASAGDNLQNAQNYLFLSTPKLGWINCDRFYNAPEVIDYLVKLHEKASVLIAFNSMKAIMSSDRDGVFAGVPLNEKITIVGLKTEDGKLMMAFHETTVTKEPFERLKFEAVTVQEYKAKLEKLNRL